LAHSNLSILERCVANMAAPKKPSATFEVEFDGPGIYPERIPLNVLSRALAAVQRLAAGLEYPEEDGDETPQGFDGKFGLLHVKRGSAVYQIATRAPELAIANLRDTGKVLEKPESIGDREFILNPLDELSAVARSLDSPIILKEPGKDGVVLAKIVPSSYATVSDKLFVSGDTTLIGRVERVGGATEQKCGLRLHGRSRMLICKVVSAETARRLGQKLYEKVVVTGTAQWIKTTWKVVAFTISEVHQPRLKPVDELIESLRNAGGSDWDKIPDPQAYLEEMTGER